MEGHINPLERRKEVGWPGRRWINHDPGVVKDHFQVDEMSSGLIGQSQPLTGRIRKRVRERPQFFISYNGKDRGPGSDHVNFTGSYIQVNRSRSLAVLEKKSDDNGIIDQKDVGEPAHFAEKTGSEALTPPDDKKVAGVSLAGA